MKNKTLRLAIVAITLMAMFALPYPSPKAASNWKVFAIPAMGVEGANNNIAFAYDRFVIVAPFAPTKPVEQIHDLSDLDNCTLYVADTKKPNDQVWVRNLESPALSGNSGKRVYYPSHVQFDPASSTVYVRGTRFEKIDDNNFEPIEALAYLHLSLDIKGKPTFDSDVIVIDIKGVGEEPHSADAPVDFALGDQGEYLVFTNGASFFTFNTKVGYVYQVDIVPGKEFGEDSQITYLTLDDATRTVIVGWNRRQKDGEESFKSLSELSFYSLDSNGVLELKKRVSADQFPDGSYLIAGSNVVVTAHTAYFATSDGSVCQVDLDSDGIAATAKRLYKFDELAAQGETASPRIIQYNPESRVIGVARQGFTAQIRRPASGKRGIIRSLSLVSSVDAPGVALVKLGKKNKVTAGYFADGFNGADGISGFITGKDSEWLLSTRGGDLLSIDGVDDPSQARLEWQTQLGARTDRVAYFAERDSVIAVNSCATDGEDGSGLIPGSIVVARRVGLTSQISGTGVAYGATGRGSVRLGQSPSIRRPCNIKGL
jgi:hypothetical protein